MAFSELHAMADGNPGIYGICGNLFYVSYRRKTGFKRSPLGAPTCTGRNRDLLYCRVSVTPKIPENAGLRDVTAGLLAGLPQFEPRRGLRNGHVQTIVGNFLPRPAFRLRSTGETVEVDPNDGSRVLCHCHWQPEAVRAGRLTVLLVHGLEGSSDSRYIQGIAERAWEAGCNVVRMNMRNCGGTDTLTPTLYHSGLSDDVGAVMRHYAQQFNLQRVALVGYSMGGNLVLKLAGEWGNQPPLCAVAAVCPAIDLAAGSDALHEPVNRLYEWNFLRRLMARYAHKAKLFPAIYETVESIGPVRSIREFDDKIVARYWGFRDADDYYYRAASARVVDRIAVPTLILHALDDPFIRLLPETGAKLLANPHVRLLETRHGGHCAFLCGDPGNEIHWAEATVIRYILRESGHANGS
jgi:predicted alpha/beta-fold hydrolase